MSINNRHQGCAGAQPEKYGSGDPAGQADGHDRPVRFGQVLVWPLIPSTPTDSAGMWRAFPPMPGSSWARWKSRTWTTSSGLSPAISIDQKTTSKNPRSTVGTVTEIYDYLRLLYARIGIPHCPVCGREISQQTVDQMVDQVLALPEGTQYPDSGPRGARPQGRARRRSLRRCAASRLCPCAGGRQSVRPGRGDQAGKEQKAHHRDRGGPPGGQATEIAQPPGRLAWRPPSA